MTRLRISVALVSTVAALAGTTLLAAPSQAATGCDWSAPVQISTGTFDALPSVAAGKPGVPAVAYYDFGDKTRVFVSDGSTLTNLGQASSQPSSQLRPQWIGLAENAKGQAISVFAQRIGNDARIIAVRRSASGVWQERQELTAEGIFGMYPQVAIDDSGRAIAVWTQNSANGGSFINGRAIGPKGSLGKIFRLGNGQSENAVITISSSGTTAVAWDEVGIRSNPVWAATSPDGGRSWSDAALVSTPRAATDNKAIAAARSGRIGLVWDQEAADGTSAVQVVAASTKRDNVWIDPVALTQGNHLSMNGGIATGDTNEFTVAWISAPTDGQAGKNILKVSSGLAMDALTDAVVLDRTGSALWLTRAHVSVNQQGVAAIAWEKNWNLGEHTGNRAGMMGAVRIGGMWQPNQLLRTWRVDPGYSHVAIDTTGVVTVAWDEGQGDTGSVAMTQCSAGPVTRG